MAEDEPPQGVIVCVRVRPMFLTRPDGTPAREATCKRVVEMEGKGDVCGSEVTKIYNPAAMSEKPREYRFDRSYWSCDGFKDDPARPGFNIPDGPNSQYVSQDMVWGDIGQIMMKNILDGYDCTVFAYGQSGSGKSYSVVGYAPNHGIIPNTVAALYDAVESNKDANIRYQIEIAMLEVYMDELYDLLEPKKEKRQQLAIFRVKDEIVIYDPKDRKNQDKIWRAAKDRTQCDRFRSMGDANRSIRATGMNPTSSRGHTLFMMRFRKERNNGGTWTEEFRNKITLVDLAGSERAHDTGLTGIGLEEGIAINKSLTSLGQCLVSLCKGEAVSYQDKLTKALSDSLEGNAITIMIAALSPADINYEDTVSTLRFADNAKKMPVKPKKRVDPTAELIANLQEENAKLQKQVESLRQGGSGEGIASEEDERQKKELQQKLAETEQKLSESQKVLEVMEGNMEKNERFHLAALASAQNEAAQAKAELQAKISESEVAAELRATAAEATQAEIKKLEIHIASLQKDANETAAENEKLELLLHKQEAERIAEQEAKAKEQILHTELMEACFEEIQEFQQQRDAVRMSYLRASGADADSLLTQLKGLEDKLQSARASCEAMYDKAVELGIEHGFRAAALALQREDHEADLLYLQEKLAQVAAGSAEEKARLEAEVAAASAQAAQTSEQARLAAESALAEKVEALQVLALERDQARLRAEEAEKSLEQREAELREKQAAIEGVLQRTQESWESKVQAADEAEKRLKQSFADFGLTVPEILGVASAFPGMSFNGNEVPHFINLREDAHNQCLIYFVPTGTSMVKRYDPEDIEVGIKLHGSSIQSHHATLIMDPFSPKRVIIQTYNIAAIVYVNGKAVQPGPAGSVELCDGDRVIFGSDYVFRYVDPLNKSKETDKTIDLKFAIDELRNQNQLPGPSAPTASELAAMKAELAELKDLNRDLVQKVHDQEKQLAQAQTAPKSQACHIL
jgi:hypothetical protein